ncbi:unnamed protein product, partial [Effrenium voratum]
MLRPWAHLRRLKGVRGESASAWQVKEEKRRVKEADLRGGTFEERGFEAARDKRRAVAYWPPQGEGFELPGGRKQVRVLAAKSDVDGYLEAQLVFQTRGGHLLMNLTLE